ncbi:carboxymuconolactone decarboxylase family protein [Paracoccus aurantiacus]|uniref:Carboxymuconolactone decarboxylase family protein n=1 Tax=Paracoccus aurantiacus TaxID=2599412 RepID=A0A5C6RWI2_9RHOB|nr:carboxymuconolactone decarboxylase family protein [Paracoccus aurantiacus]TXB66467.1 carboxymuconolactone decarboxylase family protein [Paracoccus aurantiacus]
MKLLGPIAITLSLSGAAAVAQTESPLERAAPALAAYDAEIVEGNLWQREGLSPRDRSIVTVAALIGAGKTELQPNEFARALDNGVTPAELSGIITHLAFYAGWNNAVEASQYAAALYDERGIAAADLPAADAELLPLDQEAEDSRQTNVQQNFGETSQGVVDFTQDPLFLDLWLRPELAPRDRSLVTVSSLVANGQAAQVTYHLNRAMDNGLTREEASEALTQLAFYANWPNVFSALPVFKDVFASREG